MYSRGYPVGISFKPQRGKFTHSYGFVLASNRSRFKPQRGKFTRTDRGDRRRGAGFKPQRGKFTLYVLKLVYILYVMVSNPNGVNLHSTKILIFKAVCDKSLYF